MTLPDAIKAMPQGGRIRRAVWNHIESIDPFVDYYNWTTDDNDAIDWEVWTAGMQDRKNVIDSCSPQTVGFLF